MSIYDHRYTEDRVSIIKYKLIVVDIFTRQLFGFRRDIELEYQHSQSLRQVEMSQQQVVHKVTLDPSEDRPSSEKVAFL
jgi:hypothetical protein